MTESSPTASKKDAVGASVVTALVKGDALHRIVALLESCPDVVDSDLFIQGGSSARPPLVIFCICQRRGDVFDHLCKTYGELVREPVEEHNDPAWTKRMVAIIGPKPV